MLYLKPTDLPGKPADDYEVFDENRRQIGRIMGHMPHRVRRHGFGQSLRALRYIPNRGYSATREDAMSAFKAAWEREP
jgi:hypothetical protein